jgi:hypothetical protein
MRPTFEVSEETRIIKALLEQALEGNLVTYKALTNALGKDVRLDCWGYVTTARRQLLREKGFMFAIEQNIGLRRLTNDEKVDAGKYRVRRAGRQATYGEREMRTIDWDDLSTDRMREATANRTVLGVQRIAARRSNMERLKQLNNGKAGKLLPTPEKIMSSIYEAVSGKDNE